MRTRQTSWIRLVLPVSAFAAVIALPQAAHAADLSACGDIDIEAGAQCTLVLQNNCTTQCAPASCEAACAAQLEQQCDSQCTASADASCVSSCSSSCTTSCSTSPPSLDCTTDC